MGEENEIYGSKRIFERFGRSGDGIHFLAERHSFSGGK
jgi:hypothetical protein